MQRIKHHGSSAANFAAVSTGAVEHFKASRLDFEELFVAG